MKAPIARRPLRTLHYGLRRSVGRGDMRTAVRLLRSAPPVYQAVTFLLAFYVRAHQR